MFCCQLPSCCLSSPTSNQCTAAYMRCTENKQLQRPTSMQVYIWHLMSESRRYKKCFFNVSLLNYSVFVRITNKIHWCWKGQTSQNISKIVQEDKKLSQSAIAPHALYRCTTHTLRLYTLYRLQSSIQVAGHKPIGISVCCINLWIFNIQVNITKIVFLKDSGKILIQKK